MDKYDKEIELIRKKVASGRELQGVIHDHWCCYDMYDLHLFKYCSPDYGDTCGCLTQVKSGTYEAYTPELTRIIREDDRIASNPLHIKSIDELQAYADLQRLMDATIRRPASTPTPKPVPVAVEEPELVGA